MLSVVLREQGRIPHRSNFRIFTVLVTAETAGQLSLAEWEFQELQAALNRADNVRLTVTPKNGAQCKHPTAISN